MKQYEYFCVVSQSLTEDETTALLGTIKQALLDVGAEKVADQNMGRQRLAYPFPGKQAHGTFALIEFDIDPEKVSEFKEKIRFVKGIARSVVRVRAPKQEVKKREGAATTFVPVATSAVKRAIEKDKEKVVAPDIAIRTATADVPAPVAEVKEEKKQLTQEELDKRIDELLNEEVTPENL